MFLPKTDEMSTKCQRDCRQQASSFAAVPMVCMGTITRTVSVVPPPAVLLDIDGLAERLGTTPRFVRRLVEERRIPYLKIGRLVRFARTVETDLLRGDWIDPRFGQELFRATRTSLASPACVPVSWLRSDVRIST
jgi:excisionase family DNA binding protein